MALSSVKSESKEVVKAIESHADDLEKTLSQLELTLSELRKADQKRDEQLSSLKDEVDNIRDMIPKVMLYIYIERECFFLPFSSVSLFHIFGIILA